MNPYDSEVSLPLTWKPQDYALVKGRIHLAGCELVLFKAEAIGHYGGPRCPRCLAQQPPNPVILAGRERCFSCDKPFVCFPFGPSEKGIFYVSIPWAE